MKHIILLLLCATFVVADFNISRPDLVGVETGPGGYRQANYDNPDLNKELVERFCSQVHTSVIWLIGFAMLLWIMEPYFKKNFWKTEKKENDALMNYLVSDGTIPFILKWIGLGLLFMAAYSVGIMK